MQKTKLLPEGGTFGLVLKNRGILCLFAPCGPIDGNHPSLRTTANGIDLFSRKKTGRLLVVAVLPPRKRGAVALQPRQRRRGLRGPGETEGRNRAGAARQGHPLGRTAPGDRHGCRHSAACPDCRARSAAFFFPCLFTQHISVEYFTPQYAANCRPVIPADSYTATISCRFSLGV